MDIVTPTEIKDVAWEGELVPPDVMRGTPKSSAKTVVTLGKPKIWNAADAMKTEVSKEWVPPLGGTDYWLVRLACTLRNPAGPARITDATQTLYLRPKNPATDEKATYADSLFPERLGVDDNTEINIGLKPELKFTGAEIKTGELGAKITYRKVFPVIQSYGAGEPRPYWIFRSHLAYPLEGSQFVYAVIAAQANANGVRASIQLVVTVEDQFRQLLRLSTPEEAYANLNFTIP